MIDDVDDVCRPVLTKAIEEQVTRDWLLLMKESSEEGQP